MKKSELRQIIREEIRKVKEETNYPRYDHRNQEPPFMDWFNGIFTSLFVDDEAPTGVIQTDYLDEKIIAKHFPDEVYVYPGFYNYIKELGGETTFEGYPEVHLKIEGKRIKMTWMYTEEGDEY